MAASVLTFAAADGGLLDLSGPYGGQQVFLQVLLAWREVNPVPIRGQQGGVRGEGSGPGMDWSLQSSRYETAAQSLGGRRWKRREQGGPERGEAVQEEAASEGGMCGAAAECGTDVSLGKTQEGCLVGAEAGPVWGWGVEGDPRGTR